MIDALGFKGIWRRPDIVDHPEVVINKLVKLQKEANSFLDSQFGGAKGRAMLSQDRGNCFDLVHAGFLSDTIVIALARKDAKRLGGEPTGLPELAVYQACAQTSSILALGAKTDPALSYRGCISFGDFEVHDNFLIGPAVDEAASLLDLAQGAFVWLSPSALCKFKVQAENFLKEQVDPTEEYAVNRHGIKWMPEPYIPYKIPLKGGDYFETYAVSPLARVSSRTERVTLHQRLANTFNGGIDVQIKKQHTLRFLDACAAAAKPPIWHHESLRD
jgi:hypothetical protein